MAEPQPPPQAARIAQQDEADLVARAVAGEREAFGILVERYAGVARRVARAVLGNPEDADDAAQDAMLSALVKLQQYDPRRPFGPWLLRIVANAATDRRARRAVWPGGAPGRGAGWRAIVGRGPGRVGAGGRGGRPRHRAGRRLLRGPRGGGPRCNSPDGLGRPDRAAGAPGGGRGRPRFRDRQQLARERTVMLNRSTIWAVVFLVATFAAGIARGAGRRALGGRPAAPASPRRGRGP